MNSAIDAPEIARRLAVTGLAAMLISAASIARANPLDKEFSAGEWAVLPEYCIDTQAGPFGGPEGGEGLNRSPRARHWVGLMGGDFWNMHHYCYALRDLRRLEFSVLTPSQKVALYERARGDLSYVLKTCSPSMLLMPEVLLKLGDTEVALGDLGSAQLTYERSRQLKPDYWPAYTHWIDVLIGVKQFSMAGTLTDRGLDLMPGNQELLQRRRVLANSSPRSQKNAASNGASAGRGSERAKP